MTKEEMDAILARIKGTTNISDFADCDLVIEAVIEDLEVKKKVFAQLDAICPPTLSWRATRPYCR